MDPDAAVEGAEFRHQALLDVIEAARSVGHAKEQLGLAEEALRRAVEFAAADAGIPQAEIGRALGWDRRQVHAVLRR